MNPEELPEESDSSDEDYFPDSKVEDAVSEVDSDGDPEDQLSGSEDESNTRGRKRTKTVKKSKKKVKLTDKNLDTNLDTRVLETGNIEDQKKKADDLWADFMKDTGFKPKTSKPSSSDNQSKAQQSSSKSNIQSKKEENKEKQVNKVKITQIFEFAGEEVKVEKEVDSNSAEARLLVTDTSKAPVSKKTGGLSGIGSVLNQLGKKQKITTLDKTKLDWDRFKREENIAEELETHNKGKDGYLERQDFLQRADLRRFEIEKEIRNVERAKRFNSAL